MMYGSGGQLFACARLSVDQDAPVGRGGDGDLLPKRADGDALADHRVVIIHLFAKPEVVCFKLAPLQSVANRNDGAVYLQRLLDKVERAKPRRSNRSFDVPMPADHY